MDHAHLLEEVGLDSMWLSEHHFAADGYVSGALPVIGALLGATQRLIVATDRLFPSLYNPIRLAEEAIALDLLSGGRFVLGLSPTYRHFELEGFGIAEETDIERLEEVIEIIRLSFSGRAFTYTGRYYRVPEVTVTPAPHTPGGPPLMLPTDGQEDEARRAAQTADVLGLDQTTSWDTVAHAVEVHDRERGSNDTEIVLFAYGGLSTSGREAAWGEVAEGFRYVRHTYDGWYGRSSPAELPPRHYRLLLGAPADVAKQLQEYRRRFGERVHLVVRLDYPGMSPAAVSEQIKLWAEAVRLAR